MQKQSPAVRRAQRQAEIQFAYDELRSRAEDVYTAIAFIAGTVSLTLAAIVIARFINGGV